MSSAKRQPLCSGGSVIWNRNRCRASNIVSFVISERHIIMYNIHTGTHYRPVQVHIWHIIIDLSKQNRNQGHVNNAFGVGSMRVMVYSLGSDWLGRVSVWWRKLHFSNTCSCLIVWQLCMVPFKNYVEKRRSTDDSLCYAVKYYTSLTHRSYVFLAPIHR